MRTLLVMMMTTVVLVSACSSGKSSTTAQTDPNAGDPYYYGDPNQYYQDPYANQGYYNSGITDITSQMPQGSVAVIFGNVNTSQQPTFLGGVTQMTDPNSVCTPQFSSLLRAFSANYADPPQLYSYDGVNYTFLDYVTDSAYYSPRFSPDQILSLCY